MNMSSRAQGDKYSYVDCNIVHCMQNKCLECQNFVHVKVVSKSRPDSITPTRLESVNNGNCRGSRAHQ
jgi:hypothetical protein